MNEEKANKLRETIKLAQQQLDELMNPAYTYPMWFQANANRHIVKFDAVSQGRVVVTGNFVHCPNGYYNDDWEPHTNTDVWTQVNEPAKQWEPQCGRWYILYDGSVDVGSTSNGSRSYGVEYQTEKQAKLAAKQMRSFNRLLAYVAEFDNNWVHDWANEKSRKYYVYKDRTTNRWEIEHAYVSQSVQVYMSEKCANDLVAKLNTGTVAL